MTPWPPHGGHPAVMLAPTTDDLNLLEMRLGFFQTGRPALILDDVLFTKTVTLPMQGSAEHCEGVLSTPHVEVTAIWQDDPAHPRYARVTLLDGTVLLTHDAQWWTRHHALTHEDGE